MIVGDGTNRVDLTYVENVAHAHLLAAVQLTTDTQLWTRDKRLKAVAGDLGLEANL